MNARILYLENAEESVQAFVNCFKNKFRINYTDSVVSFDYFLYSERESYDFVIVDLAIDFGRTPLDVLCQKIPEFKGKEIPTTAASIPLLGYDYIKYVMQHRPKTQMMIKERRVVAISGHATAIRKEGLDTPEVFEGIRLVDRAFSSIAEIESLIWKAVRGYGQ